LPSDWPFELRQRLRIGSGVCSLREIGNRTGVSWETARRYLKTGKGVSGRFLAAFCRSYNVAPDWLLFGEGPMRKPSQPNVRGGPTMQFRSVPAAALVEPKAHDARRKASR
jgi:hypothetical protein